MQIQPQCSIESICRIKSNMAGRHEGTTISRGSPQAKGTIRFMNN